MARFIEIADSHALRAGNGPRRLQQIAAACAGSDSNEAHAIAGREGSTRLRMQPSRLQHCGSRRHAGGCSLCRKSQKISSCHTPADAHMPCSSKFRMLIQNRGQGYRKSDVEKRLASRNCKTVL